MTRGGRGRGARPAAHNLEAEESLLGAMLLSRDAITAAVRARTSKRATTTSCVHIHEAIMALYGQGEPVDPVTIAEELRAELLDAVGGRAALLRIQAATPASANAGHYARIVQQLALLRRLIGVAGDIAEIGYDTPEDVAETLDRAPSRWCSGGGAASQRVAREHLDSLQTTLDQLRIDVQERQRGSGRAQQLHELDSLLLGLQRSNLVIVMAPLDGQVRRVGHAYRRRVDEEAAQEVYEARAGGAAGTCFRARRQPACPASAPSAFVDDGVKPVYKITTRTGRVVRTTITHPFLPPMAGSRSPTSASATRWPTVPRSIQVFGDEPRPEASRHARVPHQERLSRRRLADDEHRVALGAPWSCSGAPPSSSVTVRHTPSEHRLCTSLGRRAGHHPAAPAQSLEEGVRGPSTS